MNTNKYLKQIIYIPILFSIFVAITVLIVARYNFTNELISHIERNFALEVKKEEMVSKQRVENIFKYIKHLKSIFPNDTIKQKKFATKYIEDQNDLKRYIFVYNDIRLEGGDKFAKMYINPNRTDLIGKYIDDSYKDVKGKEFRKEFLKEIKKDGESFVTYYYKKINSDKIFEKTSYFKYHPKFNWIIATGIYLSDIKLNQSIAEDKVHEKLEKRLLKVSIILLGIIIICSILIYLIMLKIKISLKQTVDNQVDRLREKDQQLIQQSRLAKMGEMLSMIAHQWRQPLNSISAVSTSILLKSQLDVLDKETTIKLTTNINEYTQHLSSTINNFRDFFKQDKTKEDITYTKIINSALNIVESSLIDKNIQIIKVLNDKTIFKTYKNELIQVVLNILKNSQDVLEGNNIEKPYIKIETSNGILMISDNGGGVKEEILDKIFNPYFSTKKKKDGTGLGLYMSKMIIVQHCDGELSVSNDKNGAVFKIELGDKKDE